MVNILRLLSLCAMLVLPAGCSLFESEKGCFVGASYYEHGTHFPGSDGCNVYGCEKGILSTTLAACVACADFGTEDECQSPGFGSCTWFPECGDTQAACREATSCEQNAECVFPGGQGTCDDRLTSDCTTVARVCEPPACWKARTNLDGGCVAPDGSSYDASCCDLEFRCTASRGIWHLDSCGHYDCGVAPSCSASIPGCDCGGGRTYAEGLGCVEDRNCGR